MLALLGGGFGGVVVLPGCVLGKVMATEPLGTRSPGWERPVSPCVPPPQPSHASTSVPASGSGSAWAHREPHPASSSCTLSQPPHPLPSHPITPPSCPGGAHPPSAPRGAPRTQGMAESPGAGVPAWVPLGLHPGGRGAGEGLGWFWGLKHPHINVHTLYPHPPASCCVRELAHQRAPPVRPVQRCQRPTRPPQGHAVGPRGRHQAFPSPPLSPPRHGPTQPGLSPLHKHIPAHRPGCGQPKATSARRSAPRRWHRAGEAVPGSDPQG